MTTMKEGIGDDPFDDDDDEPEQQAGEPVETDTETETETQSTSMSTQEIPYVVARQTVKEDRENEHVAFLRDEYADLEADIHEAVADEMGMRQKKVAVTDLREAFREVAKNHPDEIAETLLNWGYEHRQD